MINLLYANLIVEMAEQCTSEHENRYPSQPPKPQKETNPKAYAKRRKQKESRKRNRK